MTLTGRLIAIFAFLAASNARAADVCSPLIEMRAPEVATKVDPIIDAAVGKGFAGGVAIVRKGTLVYARVAGFSDDARKVAVTPATMFHVASLTKYLTAILTLRAAEEGRLVLSDKITKYAPELIIGDGAATIGDLMAHRSGLGSSYAAEEKGDQAEALRAISAAPYDASKAGKFRYSNDGYDALAIILERVYGMTYEQLARSRVFGQACLQHSGFWGEERLSDASKVGQPIALIPETLKKRNYGMIGSAGFLTTAVDLVMLQARLGARRIIGQASLDELWKGRGNSSIGQVAYGNFLVETPALGHAISARGAEDWGDNAILNHYRRDDIILAVVTSKGPKEGAGDLFRDAVSKAIEGVLAAP